MILVFSVYVFCVDAGVIVRSRYVGADMRKSSVVVYRISMGVIA